MGFSYIVELENIDTGEKFLHQLDSDQVHKQKISINYESIIEFIMLYEPQCEKDMLLIMIKQDDTWNFMMPHYTFDLKTLVQNDEATQKNKIGSKIGSKFNTSSSQMQFLINNSNIHLEKSKIILQIRFQCQLWADEPEGFYERSLVQTFQRSLYSQRDSKNINLSQQVKQVKNKINQIEQFAHQLHEIQADAVGINVFWANPYFATDGIPRKYIKQQENKKKKYEQTQNKLLKLSVKCISYIQMIAQQIKKSNKKVKLNIDQFNQHSFSLRNIFNVVYLICHTQVAEVKKQDIEKKFNRSPQQFVYQNLSKINESSMKNYQSMHQNNDQNDQEDNQKFENQQKISQKQQNEEEIQKKGQLKMKKTQSLNFLEDVEQELNLARIDQQKQSDNMTQRKQSVDLFFLKEVQQNEVIPSKLLQTHSEVTNLNESSKLSQQKSLNNLETQKSYLQNAFDLSQENNLINVFQEQNYQYKKLKKERQRAHENRRSRSNSKHSISSKGKSKNSRSKSKKSFQRNSINKIHQKIKNSPHQQPDIEISNITRSKKHQKKQQKKQREKQKKKAQKIQVKKQQKKAITYLIGENKWGELQKITPQDLDNMLKQKMLQKVELFIIHTSYPSEHLPVLKKYANHILVINSNPIYPQSSTFFFLKSFFKHIFETKNIRVSHEKALIETTYMYRSLSNGFFDIKYATLYETQKDQLQKLKFDHTMENINKKYIYTGSYLCCCYHPHEVQCIFSKNKTTSKYGDAHYKFHVNRCDCHHSNPMIHSCKSKKQTLGEYNIIDRKDYHSEIVYNCCCLGIKMGKYKEKRKNKQCFQSLDCENQEDPHEITNKFSLIPGQDSSNKKTLQFEQQQSQQQQIENKKELLNFEQGTLLGSYDGDFQKSMKYLNENDLLGNGRIIADLLIFFSRGIQTNPYESQIKNQNKIQSINVTNSMIKQIKIINPAEQSNKNLSQQPRVCNMFGQNSSGRKTISKYLANLMVVKKLFQNVVIQSFTKVQELKYLQTNEKVSTFYILIYKSSKKDQKINNDKIYLNKNNLPASLKCIIVTNKMISFDESIKQCIHKTPRQLNGDEMKTYIKLYQHLTPQEKNKLNQFVQLTDLNKRKNKDQKEQNKEKGMKIYANEIDSYEIISIIKNSKYHNSKYKNYLQSVSKIHPISLPSYIFISGIISQTLRHFNHSTQSKKNMRETFIADMNRKLKDFMNNNKAFYIFFDPKRNKRKSKKQKNNQNLNLIQLNKDKQVQFERIPSINQKQSQNQQQRLFKEEVIKQINIKQFHSLLYQNFRKQISLRSLDCLKTYIYYTTIQQNHIFSIKDSIFSKGSLSYYSRNFSHDLQQYRTRKVAYDNQFYQSTSMNKNSLFYILLSKQMKEYLDQFNGSLSKYQHRMSGQLKKKSSLLKKPQIEQNKSLVQLVKLASQTSDHHKQAYNQFFAAYVESFRHHIVNQPSRFQSLDHRSHESGSQNKINESHLNFTPKKQIYQSSKHIKSQSLPQKQRRNQTIESMKKIENKLKTINFQEDQKHLHYIMSAGLLYLRKSVCSHVIYGLIDQDEKIELLKGGLILINNAIILMKTPHVKHDETQISQSHKYYNQQSDRPLDQDQNVYETQSNGNIESQQDQDIDLIQNQSRIKQNDPKLTQSKKSLFHDKEKIKKRKHETQKEINEPFSIKGLLYLLFKIRQRLDSLILRTNQDRKDKANYIKKLSIVAELFILQLHLINISKAKSYQQGLSKLQKSQKVQKYLNQIFYDKGRSLNYLKECLREIKYQESLAEVVLNQVLSAYIMIITNYGRKKINQNMRKQIVKLVKYDQEYKAARKHSVSELQKNKRKDTQEQAINTLPKMKILQKISQNRDIYEQIKQFFVNFESHKTQLPSIKLIQKKSNESSVFQYLQKHDSSSSKSQYQHHTQRSPSHQVIQSIHFESQTQVYEKLLEYWHLFDNNMKQLKTHKLYQFLEKSRFQLTNQQFIHCLMFCSRYVNDFYNDLLKKFQNELVKLKEKFIMFFSADPIEFSKPFDGSSSKEHIPEYKQNQKMYKKMVENQGNNRTIILPTDYEVLDLSQKLQISLQFQKQKSQTLNDQTKSHVHFQEKIQSLQNKISSTTVIVQNQLTKKSSHNVPQSQPNSDPYQYFYIKKKLNQSNMKWLQQSKGCKYLCIDTTVGANDNRNQIIGQSQQGELIIFKKQRLAQLIDKMSAQVVFICLHNGYLVSQMIKKWTKKQIVYFNFEKTTSTGQSTEKKLSSSFSSFSSIFSEKRQLKLDLRFAYYRMIARKVTHFIIQRLVNDNSQYKLTKLNDAIKFVTHSYEFYIRNQIDQTVFYMSNQQLRRTVLYFSSGQSKGGCGFEDKIQYCQEYHTGQVKRIDLYEQDILSVQQVQQVKKVLRNKYNTLRESKTVIKIQHLNSFDKLYNIFQYYLEDKQHYEMFKHIDLQEWKYPSYRDGVPVELREKKSGQSNPSVPQTIIRDYSRVSNSSTDRRKRDKKLKQLKAQPIVKYAHKWKSQFINDLLKKDILSWVLSNKKCFIMFSNSDLINQKTDKHQQWAKSAFQNLFKLENCDNGQHLNRYVTQVKIGMLKKGDKKISKNASLFFIETRNKTQG